MKHILVVEDDLPIGGMLEEVLAKEGYRVTRAYSGTEAVLALSAARPDLVLLDLMLPGLSGEAVLPHLKGVPVIVVSAKNDTASKVGLLLDGAVDYITKPFEIQELLARIAVQFRRAAAQQTDGALLFADLRLDPVLHTVSAGGNEVRLTRTEYAILKLLLQNAEQVLPKSLLLDRLSEETPDCTESSLKMHVSNLRKKLRAAGGKDYIEAVWGIGFKLRTEEL